MVNLGQVKKQNLKLSEKLSVICKQILTILHYGRILIIHNRARMEKRYLKHMHNKTDPGLTVFSGTMVQTVEKSLLRL